MPMTVRILILEDRVEDAELLANEVQRSFPGADWKRVDTERDYLAELVEHPPDVILADYSMPEFSAKRALEILQERGLDVPFIIVSGTIGEEAAVQMMKQGAADYLQKDRLSRLGTAITRALEAARLAQEKRKAEGALRESEARNRAFVSQSWEGVFRMEVEPPISRDLQPEQQAQLIEERAFIADSNEAMAKMYGWNSGADLERRRLTDLLVMDDDANAGLMRDFVRQGYRLVDKDTTQRDRFGNVRFMQDNVIGTIENGHLVGAWGVQRDVTRRRQTGQQLENLQKMEALGRLAGGISHDFNNILGVILGHAELLSEESDLREDVLRGLQEISCAAKRAAGLTQQLLAFSRKQVLLPKVLDLNEVISETEKMLSRLIEENIHLTTNLNASPATIRVDPTQVQQVLMNLAVNARDAMPHGGRLAMETRNVVLDQAYANLHPGVRPGSHVLLSVSDSGCGMDVALMKHIFEPFFTTKEMGKGTGLGLSTVYGIVQQSGGSISVSSQPGKGTIFNIYFPLTATTLSQDLSSRSTAEVARGSETVLLVEDEPDLRHVVRALLEDSGYHVLESLDTEDALSIAHRFQGPIHLLISDVVMPGMTGTQMAASIAQVRSETRVLFITGYVDDVLTNELISEPETYLLQKPFSRLELVNRVQEVLRAPATELISRARPA
jgi:signal transduction histidine kinase/DNA-binding response OmpR family regulator